MTERANHCDAKILVIDADSEGIRFFLDALAQAGYGHVHACTDRARLGSCLETWDIDLVVARLGVREAEGLTLLAYLQKQAFPDEFLPILAVGGSAEAGAGARAIRAGADDFMEQPVDVDELLIRVNSLLEIRSLCLRLNESRRAVEELLRRRTRESRESQLELIERLARVAELRDDPSGGHPSRVGRLAGLIAQELMFPADETRCLMRAAPLHDLGNIGVPDEILRLEGGFTEKQREEMRKHTTLGACLLEGTENEFLRMAEVIALSHHERWDGLGYPNGLARADIPMPARIVAVADTFDAMTHPGRDKEACSIPAALEEIRREAGWQFDPEVVAALMRVHERQPGMLTITPRAPNRAAC